jgi:hypothetical protein
MPDKDKEANTNAQLIVVLVESYEIQSHVATTYAVNRCGLGGVLNRILAIMNGQLLVVNSSLELELIRSCYTSGVFRVETNIPSSFDLECSSALYHDDHVACSAA